MFEGKRPSNLGVRAGRLAPCPEKPNCVSTQATDAAHRVAPISYAGTGAETMARLNSILAAMPRVTVITESADYLHAECKSALLGFVDDLELYVDNAAKVVHMRSASRLGYSDLGVNRKRLEEIRSRLSVGAR
jgi:uncharacterized protein (DUF1499 family)